MDAPDREPVDVPYASGVPRLVSRHLRIKVFVGLALWILLVGIIGPAFAARTRLSQGPYNDTLKEHCASKLREVGRVMYVYSLDSGVFPEVCDSLSIAGRFTPSQLECTEGSLSSTPKPYVIVAGQSPLSDPNNLLAYETADNHARPNRPAGRNVLLVDGHVEFLEEPAFQSALARTRANLARSATQSTSPAAQRAASE